MPYGLCENGELNLVSPHGTETHSLLEDTYKDLFKVLVSQQNTALLKCQF